MRYSVDLEISENMMAAQRLYQQVLDNQIVSIL